MNCLRSLYRLTADVLEAIVHCVDFSDPADKLWRDTQSSSAARVPAQHSPQCGHAVEETPSGSRNRAAVEPEGIQHTDIIAAAFAVNAYALSRPPGDRDYWLSLANKLDPAMK